MISAGDAEGEHGMSDRKLQTLSPEELSAFMDDEAVPSGQGPSPDERATWHEYHLIGDVLRSADTARGDGLRFAASVMQRLESEPVILVPVPRQGKRVLRRWAPGLAAAAAVLMTTVVVLLGDSTSSSAPAWVAGAPASAPNPAAAAYLYAHQVHAPMPVRPASFQPAPADRDR